MSAWVRQAEQWRLPTHYVACCGARYGAMSPEVAQAMLAAHRALAHPDPA